MAKGLTAIKAKKILEDGTVRGRALTEKQKKFFGAVAGGATPLKKLNGGWLDKFDNGGVQPNYNDSNVSLPPGFKGWGYDKGGRAYNGAWDGPVTRMGGTIPGATGMMYARTSGTSPEEPKKAQYGKSKDSYIEEDGKIIAFYPTIFDNYDPFVEQILYPDPDPGFRIDISDYPDPDPKFTIDVPPDSLYTPKSHPKYPFLRLLKSQTPKKAQDGEVMYGTPEYEAAYREGRFADVPNQLDEVVITAGVDYEKYPLYDKLSVQQKEYFNDPGPIGRGVRRAAQTDRGLAEDTRDMVTGMLVQQPLSALQAPQSLMVEGIEALRGRDANFLNALTFDTQRTPSQAFNVQNPYGAFALDVVADPLNVVGVGLARKSLLSPFKNALKPNPNMYYRGIGQAGLDDAIQSGLLRAKPADQVAPSMFGPFDLAKRFDNLYVTPRLGVAQRYGKGVVAEVPTDVANFSSRYKGSDWSMMTNQSIPVENVNFYKKNFFGNYRPVNVPSSTSSNLIEAAANPGIRSNLIRFGQDVMDTPSAQIRASERFNKDWFNNPEIIRRTEEMLNQPSPLRSGMSETELLQDINLYESMLNKSPNLSATQKANIERQMKDLYAGLSKKNLQTVQQKGRFTEVFDPNNKLHQDIALTYEENPNYLGFYKGRTNQGTVNVPRTKEFNKDVGSVFTHEDLHAVTAGRKGYTDKATQILEDAVGKDQDWWLNRINTEKDPKVRADLIDRLEYLARPQEIHARVHELRKAFNLKPGQEVSAAKIDQIMMKGLKGETPVDEGFFRLLGDKEKFRKIFNKLPAFVPAAVGLGAATQMKDGGRCWPGYKTVAGKTPFSKGSCQKAEDGGWLDKFQEGGVIEDDRGQWAYPGEITKINSNNITMKGVNYPVLGVSDKGDAQMMYPNGEYQYDGNSVTEFPMAQKGMNVEGKNQKKWFDSYIRSDKYLERLGKEFPEMNADELANERWARLMNMRSTPIGFLPESSEISPEPGSTQGVYDADEYPGKIMLRPEYSEGKQGPWSYNTIPLHELGHAVDEGGKRIPQTTLDFLMPKLKQNHPDIPKETYYYTDPTEYINRLQPLRYLLQEEGIYDAKKKDFTKEDLQKAKENTRIKYNRHFKDLMENTESEEDLIEIMNTIAANPQMQQNTMVAKDGKSLVELNQLTNFTNYNTPQPGGWLDKYH